MNPQGSRVTGIIEEALVVVDFGKHEGKTIKQVAESDPEFYEQLANERETGMFAIRRQRDKSFRLYLNPLSSRDH